MHTGFDVASSLLDDYAIDEQLPNEGAAAVEMGADASFETIGASGTTTQPIAMPRPVAMHAAFDQSIRNSPYALAGTGAFGSQRPQALQQQQQQQAARDEGCATLVGTPTGQMGEYWVGSCGDSPVEV